MSKNVTEKDIALAKTLYDSGFSMINIEKVIGKSYSVVKWMKEGNWTMEGYKEVSRKIMKKKKVAKKPQWKPETKDSGVVAGLDKISMQLVLVLRALDEIVEALQPASETTSGAVEEVGTEEGTEEENEYKRFFY